MSSSEPQEFIRNYISVFGKPKDRKATELSKTYDEESKREKRVKFSNMLKALQKVQPINLTITFREGTPT